MYKLLRDTHLFLGLFVCLYVVAYGVSSVHVAHRGWFQPTPDVTETEIIVSPEEAANPRQLARKLMESHGLRGTLSDVRETGDGFRFEIGRTGTYSNIQYNAETGQATIQTRSSDFIGMLLAIHFATAGLGSNYWLQNVWGVLVVIVSLALLLLGGTGIYLWFKIHAERVVGTVLLITGLLFGVTLTVQLFIG